LSRLVIDASVAVKWLLPQAGKKRQDEEHMDHALALLDAFRDGQLELIQPPHWLAEVGAMLARLEPDIAGTAMQLFDAMEIPIYSAPDLYTRGIELAVQLNHHLFDTLYHAVALTGAADILVTADMRYFRKAKNVGAITTLVDFSHM
jgi:predicted nucleic acid-binding protein